MSLVYTGNSRARKVTVTKYVNGVPQSPVTYPTNVDMANGFFTYSNGTVNIPAIDGDTPHDELSQLTEVQYAAYLIALQTYAQEQNPGLNFATATVVPGYTAVITDDPNCPEPGTPVAAYPFNIKYGELPADACDGTTYTVYSSVPSPGVGDFIYKDIALTQPWDIAMSVLFVSPALFGGFPAAVAILAVPPYSPGEIMAITDYECDGVPGTTTTTTEEVVPGTTTTTTEEGVEGVLYWAFARCPGYEPDTCWMEDSVKTTYESSLGVFQSGDRFYGAVESDPTYLYTFYSTSQVWYSTPSCVITGVSRTEDTCPA